MRISVNPSDAGYSAFRILRSKPFVVFVDDIEIKNCITIDTKRGYVLAYAMSDDKKLILNASRTAAVQHQHFGKVEIRFHELDRQ